MRATHLFVVCMSLSMRKKIHEPASPGEICDLWLSGITQVVLLNAAGNYKQNKINRM